MWNALLRAALAIAFCKLLAAQKGGGALVGTVTDSSQAAIQATTVSITNTGTGLARSVQTDNYGNYRFPRCPSVCTTWLLQGTAFRLCIALA